jgi:hypothetical protein
LPGSSKEEFLLAAVSDFSSAIDSIKDRLNLDPQTLDLFMISSQSATDKLRQFLSLYNNSVIKESITSDNNSSVSISGDQLLLAPPVSVDANTDHLSQIIIPPSYTTQSDIQGVKNVPIKDYINFQSRLLSPFGLWLINISIVIN